LITSDSLLDYITAIPADDLGILGDYGSEHLGECFDHLLPRFGRDFLNSSWQIGWLQTDPFRHSGVVAPNDERTPGSVACGRRGHEED
jgi:hypothetical protein